MSRWMTFFECAASSASGNLAAQINEYLNLQWFTADSMPKCLAIEQFHSDERSPINFIDFVDLVQI